MKLREKIKHYRSSSTYPKLVRDPCPKCDESPGLMDFLKKNCLSCGEDMSVQRTKRDLEFKKEWAVYESDIRGQLEQFNKDLVVELGIEGHPKLDDFFGLLMTFADSTHESRLDCAERLVCLMK